MAIDERRARRRKRAPRAKAVAKGLTVMTSRRITVNRVTRLEAGRLALQVVPPKGLDLQFIYRAGMSVYWDPKRMQLEDRTKSEVSATLSASRIARALHEEYGLSLRPASGLAWCGIDADRTGEIASLLFNFSETIGRRSAMNEPEYWSLLMARLTGEFAGIESCKRLGLWCDSFVAHSYDVAAMTPCVRGDAWICSGQDQQEWRFTLILDGRPGSRESIDWSKQLPSEDVTRWMVLDFNQRSIEIGPGAAIPDTSIFEKPLQDLETALRVEGEKNFAALVTNALEAGGERLETFLRSNELWGGSGSIADQAGIGCGRGEGRRSIEAALVQLGELQVGLKLVNERTEMWLMAFRSW